MKLVIEKNVFEESLSIVERAISNRNTLPVLNNVFIEIENNKLNLVTTNLEIAIKTIVPVKDCENGKTTIPVKLISQYISFLKNQNIEITSEDNDFLNIKSEESNTKIKGISAEEFPLIPKIEKEKTITLKVKDFIENISKIVFASALDELRPVLAGVLLKIKEGKIYTVATDSYRLVEVTKDTTEQEEVSCVIPSKTILELSRIIHKYSEKDLVIDISKNQIRFKCEEIELISRLIEGQYPDYSKIIPKELETKVLINKEDFTKAIKRASLFARENSNSVKLEIKENQIDIIVDSIPGSERSFVKTETSGPEKTVAFNAQYLIDALNNIDGENVFLGVNSSITPGVIRPEKNSEIIHIVMPLKV